MAHHVLVIGGGYAGLLAAKRIARQVRRDEVRVTLVNDHENFVERIRLHQMATGQRLPTRTLAGMVRGTGVRVVVGEVVALDRRARQVRLRTEERSRVIGYDTLVYALGSGADTETVPGVADHAYSLADVEHARAFASKALRELAASGRRVCVVGGGLTGIETAAELAEFYPDLRVCLVSGEVVGPGLSKGGRAHVRRVMSALEVEIREHAKVKEVTADGLVLVDGTRVEAGAVIWNAGFSVPSLARESGLEVDGDGRALVDDTQRSTTDADLYVIGDAARVIGPGGRELRMACATGTPMAVTAADAIADRLTGRIPRGHRFGYIMQTVSLGRGDGLCQFVRPDDTPRRLFFTGPAGRVGEGAGGAPRGRALPVPDRPVPGQAPAPGPPALTPVPQGAAA
ncbi:NAD(P)/FAD-dependent oxidoreductase [Actinomadura madurae]|uniref:NAD(P)/FAD-dependent oxidoreductase n=1 Tax=Actinomadura madurae TaxID=1993 RepID=UPI0020D249CF|nr:FAD-dependent oxidoreductase [Actinomadura madurae]MCQ0007527.1 FAD-dependent oxidoreductase [Actinomadura madurae]